MAGRGLARRPRVGSSLSRRRPRGRRAEGDRSMFLVCGEALFDFFLESEAGPGGGDLRRAGRRLAVQRGDRAGAARAEAGAADRPLARPARPAAGAGAGRPRACRRDYAIPTDRPTTISLVGLDAAGRARLPVLRQRLGRHRRAPRPTCRRSGPEVSGLHFGSYSLAAAPVGDAMAALARGEPRPLHLGRSERAADGRARHGRLARAARRCSSRSPTW